MKENKSFAPPGGQLSGVQQVSIDGSAWPSGVYLYEMWYGTERKVGRLVKQ